MLSAASSHGATAAEAVISSNRGLSATVRLGEPETIEHTHDQGLGVSVYFGHRKGSASSTDLSPGAIEETVAKACAIARYTSEDDCSGLADPEMLATDIADLDLYHPWDIDTQAALELAITCEDAARNHDQRIVNSEGATLNTSTGNFVYGNSDGFLHGYPVSRHSMSCSVVAGQDGDMQSDYWYDSNRIADRLKSAHSIGEQAASRAVAKLKPRQLPTQNSPVIFQADTATGLLRGLMGAIGGHAQYRKASFLHDHLDQSIFPDWVNIGEQPLLVQEQGSAPFDSEGVATQERKLVENGHLKSYVLDSYSARKLGMKSTGNAGGVRNLYIESGDLDLDALCKEMGRGLLVTELMGQGLNTVTGDYSRGAAGFWIEDGCIQYPVSEITIAGNMKAIYQQLLAVGNDTDFPGSTRTGSWLIESMTIAGT